MRERPDPRLFRHQVIVREPGDQKPDGQGGFSPGLTTVGTFWARKRPLSGREVFNARQVKATSTHEITVRKDAPISPTSILEFDGGKEVYHVDSSLVDEWDVFRVVQATLQAGEVGP